MNGNEAKPVENTTPLLSMEDEAVRKRKEEEEEKKRKEEEDEKKRKEEEAARRRAKRRRLFYGKTPTTTTTAPARESTTVSNNSGRTGSTSTPTWSWPGTYSVAPTSTRSPPPPRSTEPPSITQPTNLSSMIFGTKSEAIGDSGDDFEDDEDDDYDDDDGNGEGDRSGRDDDFEKRLRKSFFRPEEGSSAWSLQKKQVDEGKPASSSSSSLSQRPITAELKKGLARITPSLAQMSPFSSRKKKKNKIPFKRIGKSLGKTFNNAFNGLMGTTTSSSTNSRGHRNKFLSFFNGMDKDGNGDDDDDDGNAHPGFVILKVDEQIDKFVGVILMNSVKHPFFIPFEFDFKTAQILFKSPFDSSRSKCSVVDKKVWPWTQVMIKSCAEAAAEQGNGDNYMPLQIHPEKEAILEMLLVGGDDGVNDSGDERTKRLFEVEETLGSRKNLKPDIMVFLDGKEDESDESDEDDGGEGSGGRAAQGVSDGVKRGRIFFNPRDAATSRRTRKTNTVYFVQKENESVVRYFRDKQSKEVLLPQQLQELFIAVDRGRRGKEDQDADAEDNDDDDDNEFGGKETDYTIKLTESFLNTQTGFQNNYDGDPPASRVGQRPMPSVMFYPIMLVMMLYERTHGKEAMTKTPVAKMKSAKYDKYLSRILLASMVSPPKEKRTVAAHAASNRVLDYVLEKHVFIQKHVGEALEPVRLQPRFFFAGKEDVVA